MHDHARSTRGLLFFAVLMAAAILAAWPLLSGVQANQFRVGVLPFADNSGAGGNVSDSVARSVQTEMGRSTPLQGRVLALNPGMSPNNIDANAAVAIGQAQGVDVVVVGTVVQASSEENSTGGSGPSIGGFSIGGRRTTMKATVTLQADLYSTATGQRIDSIQQNGNAQQTKVGTDTYTSLGGLSTGGSGFDNSTMGKAFHAAVTDLVKKIASEQSQMTRYTGGGGVPSGGGGGAMPAAAGVAPGAMGAGGAAAGGQPMLSTVRIDFVPGERTVFYDDFSDMVPDEPPPHWKVRGNPVELRSGGGIHELYAKEDVELTSAPFVVPPDFTFEVVWTGGGQMVYRFWGKDGGQLMVFTVRGEQDGQTANVAVNAAGEDLGSGGIKTDTSQPVTAALWVQRGRVRAYVNGQRLLDVNQVMVPPIDHLSISDAGYRPNGIRMIRMAESAPDFSTMIASTGKYVTHGIQFDTDSDRLKPDSAPMIKQVAAAMDKNPALKLEIDGYTDSVGDAAHNADLSKRRAQAVMTVLVTQFNEDASRLSSNGMGAAKPIASNDTPDGRATNRRVEFLKK